MLYQSYATLYQHCINVTGRIFERLEKAAEAHADLSTAMKVVAAEENSKTAPCGQPFCRKCRNWLKKLSTRLGGTRLTAISEAALDGLVPPGFSIFVDLA